MVDDKPTFDHAESHKDDIEMMSDCCMAELAEYDKNGTPPAPFYFVRVAILARKQRNYELEVAICEQYLSIVEELKDGPDFDPRFPGVVASPRVEQLRKRLPKAKELLEKQSETNK